MIVWLINLMKPSVTIYCPDSHLRYDRSTLNEEGIGGGVTVRVRMAHALAARGHAVKLYINCPAEKTENGVEYIHYSKLASNEADVFIASTSGGGQDLSSLEKVKFGNCIKIVLVHGVTKPRGLDAFPLDYIYAPSNFIHRVATFRWNIPGRKIFVSHHGVEPENFARGDNQPASRDPYALIYAGHPSKGLETALAVFRRVKQADPRFSLHVFGGYGLWGEDRQVHVDDDVSYHELVGQRSLAGEMQKCGFSLCLQDREEPFGMTVIEAMRAGCIVLASPVGAYPEIISHGVDGFFIPGIHTEEKTRQAAAELILDLSGKKDYADIIRRNAVRSPLTWENVAKAWEGHWEWILESANQKMMPVPGKCPECSGDWLALADGLHCMGCGNYQRRPVELSR